LTVREETMASTIGQFWSVFKLRIGLAIMLCALGGLAVTPGPAVAGWKIAVLAVAVLLSAASAGAFNQYVERDLDARMARTRNRPFVTGAFTAGPLWLGAILGILALAVAMAAWTFNFAVALHVFLGAFTYGVVYTIWLKNRTWLNIVLGGLAVKLRGAGRCLRRGPGAVRRAHRARGCALSLDTAAFWSLATALHKEYAAAGVPMLPVVVGDAVAAKVILAHTVALVLLSLVPAALGMGWIYLAGAVAGGGYFVLKSVRLAKNPGPKAAMVNFFASLVQLGLLLFAAILDRVILG
jgi:protoheme IX farnesyltransferase